jgi:hypothetical protein
MQAGNAANREAVALLLESPVRVPFPRWCHVLYHATRAKWPMSILQLLLDHHAHYDEGKHELLSFMTYVDVHDVDDDVKEWVSAMLAQ